MPNEMRDRLIELLREAKEHPENTCPRYELPTCIGCDYNKGDDCDKIARTADYLLANGVIVPPCKVGDTVYAFYDESQYERNGKHRQRSRILYSLKGNCGRSNYGSITEITEVCIKEITYKNSYEPYIGKTVFLTKEAAEKALKEGIENVQSKTQE